ncbi:hypothetical protein D3C73_1375370 [compost metagenome]
MLELLHRCAPVTGVAGEQAVADLALFQLLFDQCQHRGELREQQHPAPFAEQFFEHVQQRAELALVSLIALGLDPFDQA